MVALAPLADLGNKPYKEYANKMADMWESKGLCEIVQCKKMRSLDIKFFHDIKKYDVVKAVKNLKVPLLVIHGDADTTIDMKEGRLVYDNAASKDKHFQVLKGVDHYFNKGRWQTVQLVSAWLRKCLR